uniref:Odorant-binding protein 8 n=1 Tax=Ectropis obliqua TaxID=248899 RepID=A0A1L2BL94_ECTOB|nr:odorant-binding protein 8 [Ectropis obliqua]
MQASILFGLVFVAAGINAGSVHLEGAQKDKAAETAMQCMKETGVKPEMVAEVKKGRLSEDEDLKKFTLCFFQKAGIISPDGKLNVDVALSKLPAGVDKTEAEKLLNDCKTKKGKTAADTAYEVFKCYQAGTKTHILL